jgi:hypothetical protein
MNFGTVIYLFNYLYLIIYEKNGKNITGCEATEGSRGNA